MDYRAFEGCVLELIYKTDVRLTPPQVAFRLGCPVDQARGYLDRMVSGGIVSLESDDAGNAYYDVPARPAPTGEALSWQRPVPGPAPGAWHPQGAQPAPAVYVQQAGWNVGVAPPMPYVHGPAVVVLPPDKSVALSVVLAFLFGPLGMLYATISGGLIMMVVSLFVLVGTMGLGLFVTLPVCVVWAGIAANNHNLTNRQRAMALGLGAPASLPVARVF